MEDTANLHQSELEALKKFYEGQIRLEAEKPGVAQSIAEMAQQVQASTHDIDTLRDKVDHDRATSMAAREESLRAR